jgi:hypothetical protein
MGIHLMLDMETLGVSHNPAILSIGVVAFDKTQVLNKFYCTVDLQSCLDAGLTISASTLEWWLTQNPVTLAKLFDGANENLKNVLETLNSFFALYKEAPVWSNGATADLVWLSRAYLAAGVENPINFWQHRCYLTAKAQFGSLYIQPKESHHALADAEAQAKSLIKYCSGAL